MICRNYTLQTSDIANHRKDHSVEPDASKRESEEISGEPAYASGGKTTGGNKNGLISQGVEFRYQG